MTRTNYIFIDFENVHETDWERIVGKPAKVTLVLGEQHKNFPVAVVKQMLKCPGQVELIETRRTGKDAADMVLALHIGEQYKADPHGYFHVVSGDKGFDATIEHLREHGILAARRASFSAIPALMNAAERLQWLTTYLKEHPSIRPDSRTALEERIQTVFGKGLSPEDVATTVRGLVATKLIQLSDGGGVSGTDPRVEWRDNSAALPPPPKPPRAPSVTTAGPAKPTAPAKAAIPVKIGAADERFEKLIARLENSLAPRPKSKSKLLAHINTVFGGKLTGLEQTRKLNQLIGRGVLTIDAEEKVVYAQA